MDVTSLGTDGGDKMASKGTLTFISMFSPLAKTYSSVVRVNSYTRNEEINRTIIWRAMLLFTVTAMLSACSSGGGDDAPNAGWAEIHGACSYGPLSCIDLSADPPYTTLNDTITVTGTAFISPTGSESCSETFGASSTAATINLTGVTVSWANQTTGSGEPASQRASSFQLLFVVFCDHTWQASVPLAIGDNLFTVTAADSAGNVGRASTTITRLRDMPPTVQSTTPENNALVVAVDNPITATFSEALDVASVNTTTFLLTDENNDPISGIVSYRDGTATFTPSAPLAASTSFTATLTTGVKDLRGNALTTDYSWQFDTESKLVSVPTLITPINNVVIQQNNPDSGCPSDPIRGFGYTILFDWTNSSSRYGIAGYYLFVKNKTASLPIVDTFVTTSEFTKTNCGGGVIDRYLEGWEWHVQAKDRHGNLSPKSITGTFAFEPLTR